MKYINDREIVQSTKELSIDNLEMVKKLFYEWAENHEYNMEEFMMEVVAENGCYSFHLVKKMTETQKYTRIGKALELAWSEGYDGYIDGQSTVDIDELLYWYDRQIEE